MSEASPKVTEQMVCGNCTYKFSRDKKSRLARKCPNCSSAKIFKYQPMTADYFLRTVRTD